MGPMRHPRPVLRLAALTAAAETSIDWARQQLTSRWGGEALASPRMPFTQTDYYAAEMGQPLVKQLVVYARLADPAELVDDKLLANELEDEARRTLGAPVPRPINIDPGYLSEAKLVLASTKDRDHRIYLGRGIFAEVTLFFRRGRWEASRWTYADFQQPAYHAFLDACRQRLRDALGRSPSRPPDA